MRKSLCLVILALATWMAAPSPVLAGLSTDGEVIVGDLAELSISIDADLRVPPVSMPRAGDRFGPGSLLFVDAPPGFGNHLCTAGLALQHGEDRYLSTAGHCLLPTAATATDGADADHDPAGWRVLACADECSIDRDSRFSGRFVELGPVVYARRGDPTRAEGNDFGVVAVPAALVDRLDPAIPEWGGPTNASLLPAGAVCTHAWSSMFASNEFARARTSLFVRQDDRVFSTLLPVYDGDSGAAVVQCAPGLDGVLHGRAAVGVLTHLTPQDGAAGTTLERGLFLLRRDAGRSLSLLLPERS